MNAYMVMLRHSMDDLPLLLTPDFEEAKTFARTVREDDGESVKEVLHIDCHTPIAVQIYQFEDGQLAKVWKVRDFDTEADAASEAA